MMNQQDAARAVLIELVNILGAFKDHLVIVGGWVPDLIHPSKNHVGSFDVDLAVGPGAVGADAYSSILARLREHHYSQQTDPTRFHRAVPGAVKPVKVDLISGQYTTGDRAVAVQVNELRLSTLRGIDLAFECCREITIRGTMPDGTDNTVRARITRPEAFVLIKAFALAERAKDKDAYDIAFVLHNDEPSLAAFAACLGPLIADGLGAEAYWILTEKFATLESVGPTWAARVGQENGLAFEQARQAAFQDAQSLFAEVQRLGRQT